MQIAMAMENLTKSQPALMKLQFLSRSKTPTSITSIANQGRVIKS